MGLSPDIGQSSQQFISQLYCLAQVLKRRKEKKISALFLSFILFLFSQLCRPLDRQPSDMYRHTGAKNTSSNRKSTTKIRTCNLRQSQKRKILIRRFNKEYNEFFSPCPPIFLGFLAYFFLALFILCTFPQVLLHHIHYQPSSILSFHFSLFGRLQLLTPTVTF